MYTFLLIIHVLVCIILTIIILLQSSKGGGLAGVFGGGGGGMGAVFGGRGAGSFLSKLTTVLAIVFMAISLLMGLITGGDGSSNSIVSQERARGTASTPADILPTVPTDGEQFQQESLPVTPDEQQQQENTNQEN